jgi:rubredoxin
MSQPDPALKGKHNGNCNRTACQRPGATWYNPIMDSYYCPPCGMRLNDSLAEFGPSKMCRHDPLGNGGVDPQI